MKKYLNADENRERIIPMWINATWKRRLWCFFKGHNPCTVNSTKTLLILCGICGKVLYAELPKEIKLNLNEKHWRWNDEPVTWHEFIDRLEKAL